MANEEHLAILRKGVEEWNRWREENPWVRPDLTEADLSGGALSGANIRGGNLYGINLTNAFLRNADLTDANLNRANLGRSRVVFHKRTRFVGTDLTGAKLTRADLADADMRSAELAEADLTDANLNGADLGGATLIGACFAGAIVANTSFSDIDLQQVEGLDTARHRGPSTIGTNTLERSRGQIPDAFLKGRGLSDWEIEAARLHNPDLSEDEINFHMHEVVRLRGEQPNMLTRLFISYSHGDSEFFEALEPLLDDKGVRYWRDVHDMRAGRMEKQIDRGIRQFCGQGEPRDVLCPIALDDSWKRSDWPRWLRRQIEDYAILDFSGWRDPDVLKKQFGKLYEGIVLNYKG